MSTTLSNSMTALSKDLGDNYQSTTTGAGSATTLVDAALMAKANDWITDNTYAFLEEEPASAAAIYDERYTQSLDNTTGTLTTLTFAAAPGTGIDYSLHRLASPSEKRIALIHAARDGFPAIHNAVWDESLVNGNWLIDGSFDIWTTSTNLTYWTETTLTATQTSTAGYVRGSTYSCKLDTAAGTLSQSITNFSDLQFLRGKNVTFTCQGWCDTASALRLSISDGVTTTYSSYHAGDSAWTPDNPRQDGFYVQQTIDANATNVTFTIHLTNAAATAYVDDARVLGGNRGRLYIGHLGLAQNYPITVDIEESYASQAEPAIPVRDFDLDPAGFLYIPTRYPVDRRVRIRGTGYLDFLASGVSSTAWTSTIAIEEPQLQILTAAAAVYLFQQQYLPNNITGDRKAAGEALSYWQSVLKERKLKFGMPRPPARINWGL
jgi:hypothetical protein